MATDSFSIRITNNSLTGALPVELFYGMYSMFDIKKAYSPDALNFAYLPADSDEGKTAAAANYAAYGTTAILNGLCCWTADGSGLINGNIAGAPGFDVNNNVTIVGQNIAYKTILEYSKSAAFLIKRLRITANSQAQLFTPFECISKDLFGQETVKAFQPANFYAPTQFQPLIVDIKKDYTINRTKGFRFEMVAESWLNIVFDIEY
jgi:hypothetical protein